LKRGGTSWKFFVLIKEQYDAEGKKGVLCWPFMLSQMGRMREREVGSERERMSE